MKKYILLLIVPIFFSCNSKKEKVEPSIKNESETEIEKNKETLKDEAESMDTKKSDLQHDNLKGSVQRVSIYTYDLDYKNGEEYEINTKLDEDIYYNKNGFIVTEINFEDEEEGLKFKNIYDSNNNKIDEKTFHDGDIVSHYNNTFDNSNLVASIHCFYDYSNETVKEECTSFEVLTKNSNDITEYVYLDSKKLINSSDKYDQYNNPIELIFYNEGMPEYTVKYIYSKTGRLIGSNWYDNNNGETISSSEYVYDNNGNLIEEIDINKTFGWSDRYKYNYLEFDNYNNWTKRILIDVSDEEYPIKNYYKRTISYY